MSKKRFGLVHVYTGAGKGKTTAALGIAVRAVGQGFKVFMIQFMKGGAYTGEVISAKNYLPNFTIEQFGRGCIKQKKQLKLIGVEKGLAYFDAVREDIECGECRWCFLNDEQQKNYVKEAFHRAKEILDSGTYDILILDEINVACHLNFLSVEDVLEIIEMRGSCELILTGRDAKERILNEADLVTEMKLIKHYYDSGVNARRGIEY